MTKPPTFDLGASAYAKMIKNGFHPDFPAGSDAQVAAIRAAADARAESNEPPDVQERDLRDLYWSSIDNDTSRDLDQAEWAERLTAGASFVAWLREQARRGRMCAYSIRLWRVV